MRLCFEVPNQPRSAPYRFNDFQKTSWPTTTGGTMQRWLYAPRGKVLYWTDGQEDEFNKVAARLLQEGKKYGVTPVVVAIPDEIEPVEEAPLSDTVIDFSKELTPAQKETVVAWLQQEAAKMPLPAPPSPPPQAAPPVVVTAPAPASPPAKAAPAKPAPAPSKKKAAPKPPKKKAAPAPVPPPESPPSPAGPGGTY